MSGSQQGVDAHDSAGVANNAATLTSQGYSFVAQYIDDNPQTADGGSSVSSSQVATDLSAGLQIVSIWETNSMSSTNFQTGALQYSWETYLTHAQGEQDAADAIASAKAIGQPPGSAIYFAMDFDPAATTGTDSSGNPYSEADGLNAVNAYLQGVAAYFSSVGNPYQIGVYGAGDTLQSVHNAGLAQDFWLSESTGWTGYSDQGPNGDTATHGWTMIQSGSPFSGQNTVTSVAVDYDETASSNFGAWNTQQMPCYCRGTRILTERGERPVEELRIGDCLVTASGEARPIRWIGRRSYAGRFAAGNRHVLPVRFQKGALADNVPARDLLVSPNHAMFIDGMLIPAGALLNGASVTQLEQVDKVEYFHLELATHDVILAEGVPAESFLDDGSRGVFHNAREYRVLHAEGRPAPARYCAPRVEDGEELEAIRRRLAERAATGAHSLAA